MELLWLIAAFSLGWIVRQLGLPPLIGYLAAGFLLNAFGIRGGSGLTQISEFGVSLLLFTIGLKLRLEVLARPMIWLGTSAHLLLSTLVAGGLFFILGAAGVSLFAELDLTRMALLACALGFSSTVFAVKALEERGELASHHGRVAIGVLVFQDLVAVAIIVLLKGSMPSLWALALIPGLFIARPLIGALMNRAGHGELLILLGVTVAIGVGMVFDLVGLKADLGTLVIGALMAKHPRADELSKSLLGLKDLFLVAFFLEIGLSGTPTLGAVGVALVLLLLLPLKGGLFLALLTRFKLRGRTSLLAGLSLTSYSEFGLLVAAFAAREGWIGSEIIVILALVVSLSFVAASPLNNIGLRLTQRWRALLRRLETKERLPEDEPIDLSDAEILVCGMGMVGSGAFDAMRSRYGKVVVGVDFDPATIEMHRKAGRRVVLGDAADTDFWTQVEKDKVRLVMLSIPNHNENLAAVQKLKEADFKGMIAATALYKDEVEELERAGVTAAFNFFAEAGNGFADHVCLSKGGDLCEAPPFDDES